MLEIKKFRTWKYGWIIHVILMSIGIGFITLPIWYLKRKHTFITVGERMVKGQQGILRIRTLETNIPRIDAINVEQGLLDRKFNVGNITIISGSSVHSYKNIEEPIELKKLVEANM